MQKSAGAFIVHNKKLLMMLRDNNPEIPNPNCWGLIGGMIEDGESSLEALVREILDLKELGFDKEGIYYIK